MQILKILFFVSLLSSLTNEGLDIILLVLKRI